jgi:hypothetical protein
MAKAIKQFGNIAEQANHKMKQNMANVMPDNWRGHGDAVINTHDFNTERQFRFAERLFNKMLDKHPRKDTEMLAEKVISATEKKLG